MSTKGILQKSLRFPGTLPLMIRLKMYRVAGPSTEEVARLEGALAALPSRYKRLLQPTLAFQAKVLGIDADGLEPTTRQTGYRDEVVTFSELLVAEDHLVGILV